jgi:DNA gyrase subunit B
LEVELSFQYNDGYAENIFSFANNINTVEGGTHLVGFKTALTRTINQYATNANLLKGLKENLTGEDIREGLVGVISVKVREPQFEGQTKTKLGNSEVKGMVEALVNEKLGAYFEESPSVARKIISKVIDAARAREAARKARELSRKRCSRWECSTRKIGRLPRNRSRAERDIYCGGRFGRRFGQTGKRPYDPSHPTP